ncbi:transposase [Mycobacterium sp. E2327]|uniref:transposase n=1 Tax=Mycobacterium sp. E2327 TaxID=1834132 RepID=UPI000AC016F7|nr:transposase [Mycobacterium sp. E2327]
MRYAPNSTPNLIEFNGEADHLHLHIAYPPTLTISTLAQRLKGRTPYAMRREYTGHCVRARTRGHRGRQLTSPSPAAAHRCPSSSNTSTAKPDRFERQAAPGKQRDGLTPD